MGELKSRLHLKAANRPRAHVKREADQNTEGSVTGDVALKSDSSQDEEDLQIEHRSTKLVIPKSDPSKDEVLYALQILSRVMGSYTDSVLQSWVPRNKYGYDSWNIENILLEEPSSSDGYIYVYCDARSSGYVKPGTDRPLAENLYRGLPLFERTNGDYMHLDEALHDKSEDLNNDGQIKEASDGHKLLIKIGRSKTPQKRLKKWQSDCRKAIMPLMIYSYETQIGQLTNPVPERYGRNPFPRSYREQFYSPAKYANDNLYKVPWYEVERERKIPYCQTIEKLLWRQLSQYKTTRKCKSCKKTHIEWFEIPATVEGIKKVDAVIRRWVAWAKDREAYKADEELRQRMFDRWLPG